MATDTRQRHLIEALCDPARFPHPANDLVHHETHISHILLAGDYAYKIKKPLDLGFLDFSTLGARRACCEAEVRLNARLAPQIYLDVVTITGSPEAPELGGTGGPIEYAVRMRRFDEAGLLDRQAAQGQLDRGLIQRLAQHVAAFHEAADAEPSDPHYGSPAAVIAPARDNFAQIRPHVAPGVAERLDAMAEWTENRFAALSPVFERRRAAARVRECHGDMHLGNIALIDAVPAIFDGIEFNAAMRWTDVAADVAFLVMDLDRRGASDLAGDFLDEWLATTGDYDALQVMGFYLVYRALVRAKIAAIRKSQHTTEAERAAEDEGMRVYLGLAECYAGAEAGAILVTRGVAGSGKSAAATGLVERLGAVRLRADVERHRLYPGCDPQTRYAPAAHDAVYARLEALAQSAIAAGFPAIVDATCLERDRRRPFEALAARHGIPFRILDIEVPEAQLRKRVAARYRRGDDVSEAGPDVMEAQLQRLEPLADAERAARIPVDNAGPAPVIPRTGLAHGRGLGIDGDAIDAV